MSRKDHDFLTPALQQAIVEAVATGVSPNVAGQLAGLSSWTVGSWIQRGLGKHPRRKPTPKYVAFAEAIAQAQAQDEARRVEQIRQAGAGGVVVYEKTTVYKDGREIREVRLSEPSWQAHAFHLERRYPERWGRKDRLDMRVTIEQAAAKVATELGLTVDEVLLEAQALLLESPDAAAPGPEVS